MTDHFPHDEATVRIAARDQHALRYAATRTGVTVREYLETVIARHADRLPLPPLSRPRESQTERRARLRAESPDGMSPYTRELQTIPTTKEHR